MCVCVCVYQFHKNYFFGSFSDGEFCISGASPSDCLELYLGHSLVGGSCRDAVSIFYSPSRFDHTR